MEPASEYHANTWVLTPRHDLQERRPLDGQERSYLVTPWADETDRVGDDQDQEAARACKGDPSTRHQPGPDDEHSAPADPVRLRCDAWGNRGIVEQRQRQKRSCLGRTQPKVRR